MKILTNNGRTGYSITIKFSQAPAVTKPLFPQSSIELTDDEYFNIHGDLPSFVSVKHINDSKPDSREEINTIIYGATGLSGTPGATGPSGLQGATGIQGTTGIAGINGVTGVAGINGATGIQGITGATGAQGIAGATGIQGVTGVVSQSALDAKQNKGSNVYFVGAMREYTTIQAALNAIGNSANLAQNQTPYTVLIDGGVYDEDLTLPKGRVGGLIAMGTVILGNGLGTNWSSTNTRNITWESDSTFSYAGNPPRPAFTLGVMSPSDATSTFISQANCWKVSGQFIISGDGLTNTLVMYGVELNGTFTRAAAGLTNIIASRCLFKGAITGTSMSLARIDSCQFDALVSVNDYNCVMNSEIKAGMTVVAVGNSLPPNGMFHTTFTGTFTGPANSFRVDNITDYFATLNGVSLAGSATKVLLSSATGTWGSITGTLSNQTDLQSALNAKATKIHTVDVKTANYTLVLTDADTKFIRMNVATANTLTIPTNSTVAFPIGTEISFSQMGLGQVTLTPAGGVTINSADSALKTRVQFSVCGIIKVDTDTWTAYGDLTA